MKKLTIIYSFALLLLVAAAGCTLKDGIDQDTSFLSSIASANAAKIFDISTDNSGKVRITPTGEGVSSYLVAFGHGTGGAASATVLAGGNTTHAYPEGAYTVSITAIDMAGNQKAVTYPLTVTYRAPENLALTINQTVHTVKVSAKADFAASYLVFWGDVANEAGTALAVGADVTHVYATSGNYNVKVQALSGGAAKSEKTQAITVTDQFGFPIDFDNAFINYQFGTFGGGQAFAKVANPSATGLNTSALVGKFTRGYEGWSGTWSSLDYPIDFSTGKKIKVLVYNPDVAMIGKKLNVELEWAQGTSSANPWGAILKVPVTKSGAWEELVFDFSTNSSIPANAKFMQLVLRYNDSSDGAGAIIYVDNFRLTN